MYLPLRSFKSLYLRVNLSLCICLSGTYKYISFYFFFFVSVSPFFPHAMMCWLQKNKEKQKTAENKWIVLVT